MITVTAGWWRRVAFPFIALLMFSLSLFTPETFGGTPRFNRPLGEVRGTSPAQVSFDGGNWISLGSGTLPVFEGTLIGARSGIAVLTLSDGSRMEASPTTELAVSRMGSHTNVRVASGNVLFRLPPFAWARLSMPGGVIQTVGSGTHSSSRPGVAAVSNASPGQTGALGVVTAQKGGIPRVRIFSGEAFLLSQDGSVKERLGEGETRTLLAQSAGAFPLKRYAGAQEGDSTLFPPTDPPSNQAGPGLVWAWNPSKTNGWEQSRIAPPPQGLPPEQALRRGFAWAWEVPAAQWVVVRRECRGVPTFFLRAGATGTGITLPPPTDPPGEAPPEPGQVWAWNASNPEGWVPAKLGKEPKSPSRPEQELRDGFMWAWNEPKARWDVVEECDLAGAFLAPAFPLAAVLTAGTGVAAVSIPAAVLTSHTAASPTTSSIIP